MEFHHVICDSEDEDELDEMALVPITPPSNTSANGPRDVIDLCASSPALKPEGKAGTSAGSISKRISSQLLLQQIEGLTSFEFGRRIELRHKVTRAHET